MTSYKECEAAGLKVLQVAARAEGSQYGDGLRYLVCRMFDSLEDAVAAPSFAGQRLIWTSGFVSEVAIDQARWTIQKKAEDAERARAKLEFDALRAKWGFE